MFDCLDDKSGALERCLKVEMSKGQKVKRSKGRNVEMSKGQKV